ncbi:MULTISPECIES: LysR family transcriptional regulator [unclassified Bradyrhizobium]|uniref:LysR family transcriptional regulator n=1 Tax=unclassified Bradyrhizobium TaxID=2631580 RepID=UPI0020B33C2E|nr:MULTISPECIES: LysR family transcriptional regulator [unclassified Bradyrhizobium]MCP3386405.1 LysR family transcriptional regulator [Bradyrhizobium sp. CCGUVB4N]MCP3447618.1 LysR family transcriptional regulator [Bradyrhizobium sp. CCGUVB14]WFU80176.1 LysR family transcriptional regulator [Bradyrhizobium sp. CIAT3101]
MSIRQLRTLVAIADRGSFNAAAQRLFITQSAVSMQMKALEAEMRAKLFDRASRPPVLNANGWRLVDEARQIIERYDALRLLASASTTGLTGSVRLGVIPSVATHLLPQTLSRLRADHASLRIQVQSGLSPELAFKVESNTLDVAIITELERLDPAIVFEPISEEELKVVIHKDLARGSIADLLRAHPFIRFDPAMGVGRIIDATLRERRIPVNDFMEFDSIETMVRMVKLKLGVAVIPVGLFSFGSADNVRSISFVPPVHRRIGMVARRGMIDAPTVRTVTEAFKSFAGASRTTAHVRRKKK